MYFSFTFFFFSSRRRHTRFDCDWSSDVCSSDLLWMIEPVWKHLRTGQELHLGILQWKFLYRSRSEEHTSELQSQSNLVCRLLLEKKKKKRLLQPHSEMSTSRSTLRPPFTASRCS